jgi:hypothetical protein
MINESIIIYSLPTLTLFNLPFSGVRPERGFRTFWSYCLLKKIGSSAYCIPPTVAMRIGLGKRKKKAAAVCGSSFI